MNKTECPKTVSGRHVFKKKAAWDYPECLYCGLVDDTKKVAEEPIKIKRNKAEEERILAKKAK